MKKVYFLIKIFLTAIFFYGGTIKAVNIGLKGEELDEMDIYNPLGSSQDSNFQTVL